MLIGHISYDYRNPNMAYGVDFIAACLLLILCFAPIGRAMSLDRVREVRSAKRKNLGAIPPTYMLAAAIFLHVQFALLMNLYYFSFVMIMGHMSFVRPEWLSALGAAWKRKMSEMEMIYDGTCGFCKRSMAWFLAFDGLGQIEIRDFRTDPSPVVSDGQMLKALYLVLPDGRALPGFEAYRCVVLRVPGLWWQIPFFFMPVFSRLFGHPIYNWIAANRSRL